MADQTSCPTVCREQVLWRKSGGDPGNHTRREDGDARRIGQSAWLNTSEPPYTAKELESMILKQEKSPSESLQPQAYPVISFLNPARSWEAFDIRT